MRRPFYSWDDPLAARRELDDKSFALDHFEKKLFRVPERLHTEAARRLAEKRVVFMKLFVENLADECFVAPR
jgi:uncharacterized protein